MTLELMAAAAVSPTGGRSDDPVPIMRDHVERALQLADFLDLGLIGIHLDQALHLIIEKQHERGKLPVN